MTPLSFEFFPPKSERGFGRLLETAERLAEREPEYFSVTYGAGGSSRERTRETVIGLARAGHTVAAHLSFGDDDEDQIAALVDAYLEAGVNRIVALRGDQPSGFGKRHYRYASDLVGFLRDRWGDALHIEVAAYPEVHPDARSPEEDLDHFGAKVARGADGAITQYFYNSDAYEDFLATCRARGITIPIVPGIMPITNYDGLKRFSDNCGAEIPRWIRLRLEALRDDGEALERFGTDVVVHLCRRLLQIGAPGLHFYTLNQAAPSLRILDALRAAA